jgi:hypothetical protein
MNENVFKNYFRWLMFSTLLPYIQNLLPFIPTEFAGFNITGISWVILFIVSNIYHRKYIKNAMLPYKFWLPWFIYIIIYSIFDFSFDGLQLTLQYILPLYVGYIVSGLDYNKLRIEWINSLLMKLTIFILFLYSLGKIIGGGSTPYSAQTPMFLAIPASIFIGAYYHTWKLKYFIYFIILFLVPILDITRTAILVFLLIFALYVKKIGIIKRIIILTISFFALNSLFYMKSFQEKTFYSGRGDLKDLTFNYYDKKNDFNNSGRTPLYLAMEKGLKESPIFGNGPRKEKLAIQLYTSGGSKELHNDYLSVAYNYGYVGIGLITLGFVGTFIPVYFKQKKEKNAYKSIMLSSFLTLTISYMLFMYTDNILKYNIFFGNYYFALIGIAYARYFNDEELNLLLKNENTPTS